VFTFWNNKYYLFDYDTEYDTKAQHVLQNNYKLQRKYLYAEQNLKQISHRREGCKTKTKICLKPSLKYCFAAMENFIKMLFYHKFHIGYENAFWHKSRISSTIQFNRYFCCKTFHEHEYNYVDKEQKFLEGFHTTATVAQELNPVTKANYTRVFDRFYVFTLKMKIVETLILSFSFLFSLHICENKWLNK